MSEVVLKVDRISKKFSRSSARAVLNGGIDLLARKLLKAHSLRLRDGEFWALRDVSLDVSKGECVGIIGPNGAGKSTLLKIIQGEVRAEGGSVSRQGHLTSLIRIGTGLQPLLTGRENIYFKFQERGYSKLETDDLIEGVIRFSGLEKVLDVPVRQYSDGMYARLEFAIATAQPTDLLLIDEVLAVGDIAFQMRCLERLEELKALGTSMLFVSHSEMNVRHIADRCLLLFDGESLALGETDALFRRYYEATGFLDRRLKPLTPAPEVPRDFGVMGGLLALEGPGGLGAPALSGQSLRLHLEVGEAMEEAVFQRLIIQFWSLSGVLLASLEAPAGVKILEIPFLGLAAGQYRLAAGTRKDQRWTSYRGSWGELLVREEQSFEGQGLFRIEALSS